MKYSILFLLFAQLSLVHAKLIDPGIVLQELNFAQQNGNEQAFQAAFQKADQVMAQSQMLLPIMIQEIEQSDEFKKKYPEFKEKRILAILQNPEIETEEKKYFIEGAQFIEQQLAEKKLSVVLPKSAFWEIDVDKTIVQYAQEVNTIMQIIEQGILKAQGIQNKK